MNDSYNYKSGGALLDPATIWNRAWNQGYTNSGSTSNPWAGQSGGGYNYEQAYSLGQQQYQRDKIANTGASTVNTGGSTGTKSSGTTSTPSAPSAPQPSQEDILRSQVAGIFDPVFSSLQGQEDTLNKNYGITQSDIGQQYDTSKSSLANQNTQGMSQLNILGDQANQTKTDALSAATRLYDELVRGGQQRFGGASSAGDAFNSLTSVEQQRRQGTIQNTYDSAMQKIAQYKSDLTSKYQDSLAQLESQKQTALNSARQQFNDALQAINSSRNQAQSDKATATLNTLNDYRNKVYAINAQSLNFAQQLAAQHDMSVQSVNDYAQKVIDSLTGGQSANQNLTSVANKAATSTNYGNVGFNTVSTNPTFTGAITPTYKKDDLYSMFQA